jgi:uroporphyrinogen-III synthase
MRILVNRPLAQAEATAELLRRRGHEPLVDPVLTIEPVPLPPIEPAGYAALLITSVNAVPALPGSVRGLPLYGVGAATAAALRAAGWAVAGVASGDGEGLARLVAAELRPGRILHIGGADRAPSVADGLAAAGFAVDHVVAYRAAPVTELPAATRAALEADALDAVLLLSPRTARIWVRLARLAGLDGRAGRLIAACLSPAVAEVAAVLRWRELRVAASRDHRALVDSLDGPR